MSISQSFQAKYKVPQWRSLRLLLQYRKDHVPYIIVCVLLLMIISILVCHALVRLLYDPMLLGFY